MKKTCILGVAVMLAACSTHSVRCHGALQPINKPVTVVSPEKGNTTELRP